MNSMEIKRWIEAAFKNYGKDPLFFIRELAQNSRDAGAKKINVNAGYTKKGNEYLIFEDDGTGMPVSYAKDYLFRLYSSSKINEKYSAGLFGIGFWSILKFNPLSIIIESRSKKGKWGILVDSRMNTTEFECTLKKRGTRITLTRSRSEKSLEDFQIKIEQALIHYCSYLQTNTRNAKPLIVTFLEKTITKQMKLHGPLSMKFKKGAVQGVVGFSSTPKLFLYAKGLPIWEGTSIEELSHTPPSLTKDRYITNGLAPVFLINGNNLNVNISRRRAIDNHALRKVKNIAEKALSKLVDMAADIVSTRNFFIKLLDKGKQTIFSLKRPLWKSITLISILVLSLEYTILNTFFKDTHIEKSDSHISLKVEKNIYSGSSVGIIDNPNPVNLYYFPKQDILFKLFHVETYEINTGFTQTNNYINKNITNISHSNFKDNPIYIKLKTDEKGTIILPIPVNYVLDVNSITLNSIPISPVKFNSYGSISAITTRNGTLHYRCFPRIRENKIDPKSLKHLYQLPKELSIPASIRKVLIKSYKLNYKQKIENALKLTKTLLKYDYSTKTVEKYYKSSKKNWLNKVINIGAGDCDIINGVLTLILRKMEIPARLVIGLIGKDGRVLPGLHAWTEYFDKQGAHILDVTQYTSSLTQTPNKTHKKKEPKSILKKNIPELFYLGILFAILIIITLFFLILKVIKSNQQNPFKNHNIKNIKNSIAEMAIHAILHPKIWGENSNIWDSKIIPALKGYNISINNALKLSKNRKLFYISRTNPITQYLKKVKFPILEAGDTNFDSLIKLIPGAINLDMVTSLNSIFPENALNLQIGELLHAVNFYIKPPSLFAQGLLKEDFIDIDLSALSCLRKAKIPNKFIAINANSERIKSIASYFDKSPQLAIFRFIKILAKESSLISFQSEDFMFKVSHKLLREIS